MKLVDVIKVIQQQIDDASPIIDRISCMKPIPVRPVFGSSSATAQKPEYGRTTVRIIEEEIKKWQFKTKAVLAACFNGDSEHKKAFERTFLDNHGLYYDAKEELMSVAENGRMVLNAVIEEESLRSKIETKVENQSIQANAPLVFISHAGNDAAIIREFIDQILKNGLGLKDENIACTSFEWTTVTTGDNISDYIRKNIQNAKIVLAMVSKEFKKSEVCQNEVGAAWALGNKPLNIVLPGTDFNELGWLFSLDKALKIDNTDSLNKLQVDLCNRLSRTPQTALHWTPCVTKFLETIGNLKVTEQQNALEERPSPKVTSPCEQNQLNHDKKLFENFDNLFPEDKFNYSLNRIQTSTHFSDYDSSIWYEIIRWLEKVSNSFLNSDVQGACDVLLKSFKELTTFTMQYYSADRNNWSCENDHNVSPEKWREIHEAKIYSWEPDIFGSELYQERERIIKNELPQKVAGIETAYKGFRLAVKKVLHL
jgi:hypothetical protein